MIGAAGCGEDPVYLAAEPRSLEVNNPAGEGAQVATVIVPMRVETELELMEREELAASLGLTVDQVPQVRRDKVDMAIELTLKNLSEARGTAVVEVIGANEYFRYDPQAFIVDEEEQQPVPLLGGRPIEVPPQGVVTTVIREDEVAEAAQDLDAITRAGFRPEFTFFSRWPGPDVTGGTGGELTEIPSAAVPAFLQFDVSFQANTHMVLELVVRVRDRAGRLEPTDPDVELVPPSQTAFAPPAPMP